MAGLRYFIASLIAVAFIIFAERSERFAAWAQTEPQSSGSTAAPSTAATAASATPCPVIVIGIEPLEGQPASDESTTWAIGFQVLGHESNPVSGTVSLFSGTSRYDVPFRDAVAAGSTAKSFGKIEPVVVQFAKPLFVNAAYVTAVKDPNTGPCTPFGAYVRARIARQPNEPAPPLSFSPVDIGAQIRRNAKSITKATAPLPLDGSDIACSRPYVSSRIVVARMPQTPEIAKRENLTGGVTVELIVDGSGHPQGSWVFETTHAELDDATTTAARASSYAPAVVACREISSTYLFVAVYSSSAYPP